MRAPKQLILVFFLIAAMGFFTLLFKKGYSAESNLQSNLNWYAVYNSLTVKP
ncbi:MAG: hypothetical protein ABIJ15_07340 [bacterium]